MRQRHGADATHGLVPGLLLDPVPAPPPTEWVPATALISGERLDDLLAAAARRWDASPHAAAALAWKAYTYWLSLPAVLGWASARRVPLLDPADVAVHFADHQPFLTLGLRRMPVAVLPSDPLATSGAPDVTVVESEERLRGVLRATLRTGHLDPLLARIRTRVRLGERTLLGSLASGAAYGLVRAADALPGPLVETVRTVLETLGVAELVTLEPDGTSYLVRRHTCCLAFTLPQPKVCSGCCIR
jgi:hypothetical protein